MSVVLSARAVQRGAELPLLEAIARGLAEQELIFNRRPGVDSLVELVPCLADGASVSELRLLARLCSGLSEHNVAQLRAEREVAGWACELASDLHALELSGGVLELGVRELAERARGPLRVLLERVGEQAAVEVAEAARDLDRLLGRAPRAQLFGGALEGLLGGRRYRLLERLDEALRDRVGEGDC